MTSYLLMRRKRLASLPWKCHLRLRASLFISIIGAHRCWVGQVSGPLCRDKAWARDMAFVLDAGAIFDIAVATGIRQLPQVFLALIFTRSCTASSFTYTPRLSKGGQTKQSQKLSSVKAKHPSPGTIVRLWNYVAKSEICTHATHVWRDFGIYQKQRTKKTYWIRFLMVTLCFKLNREKMGLVWKQQILTNTSQVFLARSGDKSQGRLIIAMGLEEDCDLVKGTIQNSSNTEKKQTKTKK